MTLRTYGPCTTCCAAALVGAATLFLACGASPAGGAARAPGADPSEGGVVAAQADAGPTTTTTLTLGDGGDLQGTKLGQSATTTVQTAIDGGPHGPHQQDPGRSPKDIQAINRCQTCGCFFTTTGVIVNMGDLSVIVDGWAASSAPSRRWASCSPFFCM